MVGAMTSTLLQKLEHAIIEDLGDSDIEMLASAVMRLSDAFTHGRAELALRYLDDPLNRRAYIAGFLLTNAAKVFHCLDELAVLDLLPLKGPVDVLDLGCGPGTASLATSLFFAERVPDAHLNLVAVEQSAAALGDAVRLLGLIAGGAKSFLPLEGLAGRELLDRNLSGRRFDIVIAANVFNEFESEGEAADTARALLDEYTKENGLIIIIDPALRETTRPMMKLRDELVKAGVRVLAPCLNESPCPMLAANERDWCHFYVEWDCPKLIERIDCLTGLDHRYIKMAYLMLAREGSGNGGRVSKEFRVVSSPLVSKGKRELLLCGSDGKLVRAMRQDKHASEANRGFELARRGDVVSFGAERKILPSDSFDVVRRWR